MCLERPKFPYSYTNARIHRWVESFLLIFKMQFRLAYSQKNLNCLYDFYAAIYLTTVSTICGFNVLVQMILINMHHVRPVGEVPRLLRMVQNLISCRQFKHAKEVQPANDENGNENETVIEQRSTRENNSKLHSVNESPDTLHYVQVLCDKVESERKENALLQDWKLTADTFDRFFSCLFLLAQMVTTIVCFGILPHLDRGK